eukprot:UN07563
MLKNKQFRRETLNKQLLEKEEVLKSLQKDIKAMKKEIRKHDSAVVIAKNNFDEFDMQISEKEKEIFDEFGGGELGVSAIREH